MAAAPAAADPSADMPTFKLVLVGDGGTGEDGFRPGTIRGEAWFSDLILCHNID